MSVLREIIARFSVDMDTKSLDKGETSIGNMVGKLQQFGAAIAGAAVVVGVRNFIDGIREAGDELDKTSVQLGLSTQALQVWRSHAGHAGVSAEQLTPALQALRRNADAARMGAAGMAADFRALGVSVRDQHGNLRSTDELLRDVADGIRDTENPGRRAAIAMRLMGESGARLLPMLEQGSEGADAAAEAFARLGGGMSDEAIRASAELTDAQQELDESLASVHSRIGVFLLPAITRLVGIMTDGVVAVRRMWEDTRLLHVALGTLAAGIVAMNAQLIIMRTRMILAHWPVAMLIAAIGLLVLVFEDLWSGLNGGPSALADLGREFDEWTDNIIPGQSAAVDALAGAWLTFRDILRGVASALARVMGYEIDPPEEDATLRVRERWANSEGAQIRARRRGAIRNEETARQGLIEQAEAQYRAQGGVMFRGAAPSGADIARTAPSLRMPGAPAVTQSVRIDQITVPPNTTPQEIERHVAAGISRALASQADDTLDVMGGS